MFIEGSIMAGLLFRQQFLVSGMLYLNIESSPVCKISCINYEVRIFRSDKS